MRRRLAVAAGVFVLTAIAATPAGLGMAQGEPISPSPQIQGPVCVSSTTRPDYASAVRQEYSEPFISKAETDALAKLRACAKTEADRAWMVAYGERIHTAYSEKRYMKRLWGRCADTPDAAVKACIRYAALKYHQPYGDMVRVANCESGRNPKSAGHHQGMYQYLFSTWATTPYASKSVYSARWSSLATAWMWSVGRRGEWACQ